MGKLIGKLTLGSNFKKTLYDLDVNEVAYADYYAFVLGYGKHAYLNLNDTCHSDFKSSDNGLEIKVKRVGPGKDDFDVDISNSHISSFNKTYTPFGYGINELDDKDILIAKVEYDKNKIDYKLKDKISKDKKMPEEKDWTTEKLFKKLEEAIAKEDYETAKELQIRIDKRKK